MITCETFKLIYDKEPEDCTIAEVAAFGQHCQECEECNRMVNEEGTKAEKAAASRGLLALLEFSLSSQLRAKELIDRVMKDTETNPHHQQEVKKEHHRGV
jgi:hypothetical protein